MNLSTSASALRRLPPFQSVSLRLLQDLVEFASDAKTDTTLGAATPQRLLLVQTGQIEVVRRDQPNRLVPAGRMYLGGPADQSYRGASGQGGALVRDFRQDWLRDAVAASFTLARSIDESARELLGVVIPPEDVRAHRLFLAADDKIPLPVEALGCALVAQLCQQFEEQAAVVVLDHDRPSVSIRMPPSWEPQAVPLPSAGDPSSPANGALTAILERLPKQGTRCHLVFVHPAAPWGPPGWWPTRWFHRVLWATPQWHLDDSYPEKLFDYLLADLWTPKTGQDASQGPFFSSFIPTVIGPAKSGQSDWSSWMPPPLGRDLRTLEVVTLPESADFMSREEPLEPKWRLFRDRCRLVLPPVLPAWSTDNAGDFVRKVMDEAALRTGFARWARAVTNRQVGMALSGGGASSAALVPLIEKLLDAAVPIDVVSGVSGGALLGAFFCRDNLHGVDQYRQQGIVFQLALVAAMVNSWFVERTVDALLPGTRVEDLGTRLVAVTTELLDQERDQENPSKPGKPQVRSCAVISGTVGEAVRVSGASPILFGPAATSKARYLDGATAVPVPARVLPDFGADLVFAFNSIANVLHPNLLRALVPPGFTWLANFLYRRTLLGRFTDGLTAFLTSLGQASQVAAEDSDVFYQVTPASLPMVDGWWWPSIRTVANDENLARQPDLLAAAADAKARWDQFRSFPRRL
jgi:predicted acylesterase/phospholipase RssA